MKLGKTSYGGVRGKLGRGRGMFSIECNICRYTDNNSRWSQSDDKTPTAEVRAVSKTRGDGAVVGDDVDKAFLDEEHLGAGCALLDDQVAGKIDLELQLTDYLRYEARIGVGKERDGRN